MCNTVYFHFVLSILAIAYKLNLPTLRPYRKPLGGIRITFNHEHVLDPLGNVAELETIHTQTSQWLVNRIRLKRWLFVRIFYMAMS